MSSNIVIAAAARTAIGSFGGALASLPAHQLGAYAIAEVVKRAGLSPADIDDVAMGHVLTAAQGQNTARQAAMAAGIPPEKTAMTINQVCGSGLRAVAVGMQSIKNGDAAIVVAGGQESMSLSPHAMIVRHGVRMGHGEFTDTMIKDGLWDAFNNYHMGQTAENVAKKFGLTREAQDAFACASQNKAEAAMKEGRFKNEILPVTIQEKKGDRIVADDEGPRAGTTRDALAKLRPAFTKDGTVTAGNASSINDGAAALVLMREDEAARRNIKPLARIAAWATAGVDPAMMGTGPVPAARAALKKAGWNVQDLDLIESNEAFAAQAMAVNKEMGWDEVRVNVNGGAIALGHPIGASGARVLVTLLHEMARREAKKGLATLCIGGGMGIALCVERSS